jgi:hypothetical protein
MLRPFNVSAFVTLKHEPARKTDVSHKLELKRRQRMRTEGKGRFKRLQNVA